MRRVAESEAASAAAVRRVAIKSAVARGASRGIGTGLDGAAAAATLLVGAHEVLRGNMSAGALATFLLPAMRAFRALSSGKPMDLTSSSSFSSTIGNTSSSSWGAGGGASAMVTSVSSAMAMRLLVSWE